MLEKTELDQLDKGWTVIMIIWAALLASIGFYLVLAKILGNQINAAPGPDFPVATFKLILYIVSLATLVVTYFVRKAMLNATGLSIGPAGKSQQHPALGKYTVIIIVSLALSESIAIYGLVLFFIARETMALYQLMIISAAAMIYYRPKKEELLALAEKMKADG